MTLRRGAIAIALAVVAVVGAVHAQSPAVTGAAFFVRGLENLRDRHEARPDILDTPIFPGSVVKAVALVAALESGVIQADSARVCRRVSTVDGHRFECAHPDLKRALSPAEALAYSCDDFFASLSPRLSRDLFNRTRLAAGLPPVSPSTPLAPAIVGLDGPKTTPRALIGVLARLMAAGGDPAVPMKAATRNVLRAGLRGAAEYGAASGLNAAGVSAFAGADTVKASNGAALELVVALVPADRPTRGIVVAAPAGAGVDAAAIAAEILSRSTLAPVAPVAPLAPVPPLAPTPAPQAPYAPLAPIRLGRTLPDGRTWVETIPVDDYIAQVLAGEGQPRAGDAAQQALAITARTFAMANRNRHRRERFDLCDTTHCQVVRPSTVVTRRAAQATSGRLLLHQGQPAFVFYSAWCGGRTELASQVWPGAIDYPFEPSLADDACEHEAAWTSEIRAGDLERALRAAGLRGSTLRGVRVVSRNQSERVDRVRVDGFTPPEMNGHEFRMAVSRVAGPQALKSTAFDVERTGNGYRFRGRGYGHGVGLCVVGAGNRAARGSTADDILRFYFPGLTVGPVLVAREPGRAAVPAPVSDVALVLPGQERGEREPLLSLIRRSRDEVAKATGVALPGRLLVTVHASVESFGRATGQPWWVSGATDGSAIELLPIAELRRQGLLERTVRREVTHALLDGALSNRPMWVREGAAAYFARASTAAGAPPRVSCPSDAELLRPISAGAERDAFARAEACFARGIAEGKRWDQIR